MKRFAKGEVVLVGGKSSTPGYRKGGNILSQIKTDYNKDGRNTILVYYSGVHRNSNDDEKTIFINISGGIDDIRVSLLNYLKSLDFDERAARSLLNEILVNRNVITGSPNFDDEARVREIIDLYKSASKEKVERPPYTLDELNELRKEIKKKNSTTKATFVAKPKKVRESGKTKATGKGKQSLRDRLANSKGSAKYIDIDGYAANKHKDDFKLERKVTKPTDSSKIKNGRVFLENDGGKFVVSHRNDLDEFINDYLLENPTPEDRARAERWRQEFTRVTAEDASALLQQVNNLASPRAPSGTFGSGQSPRSQSPSRGQSQYLSQAIPPITTTPQLQGGSRTGFPLTNVSNVSNVSGSFDTPNLMNLPTLGNQLNPQGSPSQFNASALAPQRSGSRSPSPQRSSLLQQPSGLLFQTANQAANQPAG